MTGDLTRVRSAMLAFPWAMDENYFDLMVAVLMERRINDGIKLGREAINAMRASRGDDEPNGLLMLAEMDGLPAADDPNPAIAALSGDGGGNPSANQIGVINVFGTIAQHASAVDGSSGPTGTSTERVGNAIDSAVANPSIKAIVLHINSPGGSVYGVQELGNKIAAANKSKPIIAQVSGIGASAAYWLASQAGEIVVQPSGEVGSIGVIGQHIDTSGSEAKAGIVKTTIAAGKYKAELAGPLTDEAKNAMEARMGQYYSAFTSQVAKGRTAATANPVGADAVKAGYGQGRLVGAQDALKEGMIDRIGTLDQTLNRLGRTKVTPLGARANDASLVPAADAFDHLPLVSDAGFTPLMLHKKADGSTTIEGDWPQKVAISRGMFGNPLNPFLSRIPNETTIVFHMAGTDAMYKAFARDKLNPDLLVCALISSNGSGETIESSESEAAAKAEAERRARFRRMRFAQEIAELS